MSLAQNKPAIHQQFCLSEVKQPLAKITTDRNLSQVVDDITSLLLCAVNTLLVKMPLNFVNFCVNF